MNFAERITPDLLRSWPLPDPNDTEGKEERGSVLIVGGSQSVPGASVLSGIAALRSGAGKLQIATADSLSLQVGLEVPEAKVIGLPVDEQGELSKTSADFLSALRTVDAIVVGPGMASTPATLALTQAVLSQAIGTVVVDAGSLPAFRACSASANTTILTPHPGEMADMLEISVDEVKAAPDKWAKDAAYAAGAVVALKGATTHIAHPDGRLWIHQGGGPGLGTSGSGDVLTGIIAGLAARGASPERATIWGVYLHGRAGDILARRHGTVGFLAREISAEIPSILDRRIR